VLLCAITVFSFSAASLSTEDTPTDSSHFATDAVALYQAASKVTPHSGADVIVLENEEHASFDAEGKAIRTRYFLYKVLTQKAAAEWASIAANWEPWHEERPALRARVITPDNVVHDLDPSTITDAPGKVTENDLFSDRRIIRAPLPAITPGSLVEEEQVSKESTSFFGGASVERFYFSGSVFVQHTRLTVEAPSGIPIRYDVRTLPDLKPQRTEADGRMRITFESGPVEAVEDVDPDLPSDAPAYSSVTFSTGGSWQRVAEEYAKIVDAQLAASDLKPLVNRAVATQKSRDQKISALLQYVHREVRYTGVEFGEATIVPRSPNETLHRKYGDCKDKAALLVAMLRTAGIPAYVALLNAGSREDISADLPGLGMFDHAIVYVPGIPDYWIDATDEYARLGELPNGDQGRLALVARPDTTALSLTPVASAADNTIVEKREIFLAENGPARIVETSQPHGSAESSYRRAFADKENKNAKEELTNYVKSQYLAEKLDRMDRSDPHDLSQQFELILQTDHSKRAATDLDIAVAVIRIESLLDRLPAELRQREKEDDNKNDKSSIQKPKKPRTSDYQLPIAFVTEWHYTITPPPGFQPRPLPQNVDLSLGPAKLTEQFSTGNNGIVQATLRFDTVKRRMTVAEGHELRDKAVQLLDEAPILIYFDPIGQVLLNQGKIREALKSYRELIALHPKEPVHHLQLAQALLTAGLGEPARSEAQAAVKLDPTSALAEKTLADILEYDSVGRKFRPGSDYAGAEAAFRAAIALDADDKTNIANLAVLLEYNHWGLRYGPGARLKDALVEYRKLTPEKLAEFDMQNNVPFALFYDGQFAEAQKAAEALNPQPLALIVACEAALNGSEAALTAARKRTGQEEQFKQIAGNAAGMLVNIRKYSLSADLYEASASGSNAAQTVAYASLCRKARPREQLQLSDDPLGLALRFELVRWDPDLTIEQMRSISSRNGAKVFATSEAVDGYVKENRSARSRRAREGDFPDRGHDLSLAEAQPRVEGNDATGYKIKLWPSSSNWAAVYVVKEDGHYKTLASNRFTAGIGLEALDRIAANDLSGVRSLLDWLREDWHLAGGDDPLADAAFPRMWTKGKDADAATMKVAAAAILVHNKSTAPTGISLLEDALKSASTDAEKVSIMLALVDGYGTLENYEKALSVETDLAKQYPESQSLFSHLEFYLRALGRFDEADALAEKRLKRIPGDLAAMGALAFSAQGREDYIKEHDLWQKIVEGGQPKPGDLNNAAWSSIFTGKVQTADLESALTAAQLSNNDPGMLHTLGCVYAELGKTKEAHEVLIQAMDGFDLDEPNDEFWYAFGRIAEQYGERDVAIAYYNRVSKPKQEYQIPTSTYRLAQIRLQALHSDK
jgi:transglutaminase-like putative cysteine protease/tetratricopeptide (TPR) repeat protein